MVFLPKGILGINARNLLFIKPFNSRKNILFADDKLKTKHFLSARGISVPRLYGVIRNKEELEKFDFANLPNSFAVKPNLGSGGQGIIPITGRDGENFITSSGRLIPFDEFKQHLLDIIDGRFSVNNNPDSAFFEQLLITHESLAPYTYKGLPDIRIVVFNLIPVMAMLRLPTIQSDGKANLQQGAIGVGIDLAKGETTHIAQKYKIIEEIPGVGPMKIKIPFWDEILEIAVKTQLITNLGYLAADICLDQNSGPVLLEINARAGLKVQIANMAGLYKRLDRIKGIKVTTPEKGIRIAKDMFGNITERTISNVSGKKIIGSTETIEILNEKDNIITAARINLNQEKTTISSNLATRIKNYDANKKIKFILGTQRITTLVTIQADQTDSIIIGSRDLGNFLVDPSKSRNDSKSLPKGTKKQSNNFFFVPKINYAKIDHQIYELDRKIKLVSHLSPINVNEELAIFKKDPTYNPQFIYRQPQLDFIKVSQDLADIQLDDSALGQVFHNKKIELTNRFHLIESVGNEQFHQVSELNFASPTAELINAGFDRLQQHQLKEKMGQRELFSAKKVKEQFQNILDQYGLDEWKIRMKRKMNGNCSVSKGKSIFLNENAKISKRKIDELIAHEIETHILTNENGSKQPYQIFQIGTANYLKTQEGLAVYNQGTYTNDPLPLWAVPTFIATHLAATHSFAETYQKLRDLKIGERQALMSTVKAKRGLEDTSRPGCFTKGYIYFMGANQINEFVEGGGNLADLYVGKIDLESLDVINTITNLNPPYYLPHWYKQHEKAST